MDEGVVVAGGVAGDVAVDEGEAAELGEFFAGFGGEIPGAEVSDAAAAAEEPASRRDRGENTEKYNV
ncbi:MAG TPA: hypothetical protein VIM11_08040 [Tepidisphaeraceae bacterium]